MEAHCTLGGKHELVEDSAIRLSLMPWFLSFVLPLMIVVEKGGRVTGLGVLMNPFLLGCACNSLLDWVAQNTAFHDLDTFSGLFSVYEVHCHISNSGAYSYRHPFLIFSDGQNQ